MSSSKADNRRNVILTHTVESDDWEFRRGISKYSTLDFEVESMSTGNGDSKLRNIMCYFLFPFIVFLKRNHYNFIVANQQFYGLLLAFYCRLFHVRKSFKMVVIAYIYKPKNGWIGWIYQKFMQYIATSDYIDKYVVRSSRELETYPQLLGIDPSRLVFIPLGLGGNFDAPIDEAMQQRKYVLSVGRSNRNYPFLIDSPFTELSGENPANVAKNMHSFANQIILMADEISYGGVKNWIAPFVCSKIELLKNKEEGITYIK